MRVYIRLAAFLHGQVGGLCGNFDGDTENDFTTRQGIIESTAELFGNSWKVSPSCPDVADQDLRDPCAVSSMYLPAHTCWDAALKKIFNKWITKKWQKKKKFFFCLVKSTQSDLGQEEVCNFDSGALLSVSLWSTLPTVLWVVCFWCLWVSDSNNIFSWSLVYSIETPE